MSYYESDSFSDDDMAEELDFEREDYGAEDGEYSEDAILDDDGVNYDSEDVGYEF